MPSHSLTKPLLPEGYYPRPFRLLPPSENYPQWGFQETQGRSMILYRDPWLFANFRQNQGLLSPSWQLDINKSHSPESVMGISLLCRTVHPFFPPPPRGVTPSAEELVKSRKAFHTCLPSLPRSLEENHKAPFPSSLMIEPSSCSECIESYLGQISMLTVQIRNAQCQLNLGGL